MSVRVGIRPSAAVLLALLINLPTMADARGKNPVILQITNNTVGDVISPRIRSEKGNSIVFMSDGDVMGPGTETAGLQVYYYDVDARNLTSPTLGLPGVHSDAARQTDAVSTGRRPFVPFVSTGDLDAARDNSDGNTEIFFWFPDNGEIQQLTNTVAPVEFAEPYASDSGRCIVFRSNGDLDDNEETGAGSGNGHPGTGLSNPDGSYEIFNMHFDDPDYLVQTTTQVSNGPAGTTSSHPVVGGFWFTRQCRSTAYQSDHDQLGNGSTGTHIYNFTKTSTLVEQLSPVGAGTSRNPAISSASNFARGPFVVYESDTDGVGNGSTGQQIFRYRLFRNELIQYTFGDPGASSTPAVSDGGGVLAFVSTGELIDPSRRVKGVSTPPFNADGNSELIRSSRKRKLQQITVSSGCENTAPTVRDTGRSVAFRSTCDLIPGNNPDGFSQLFLYIDVKKKDPLNTTTGCLVSEGCCNQGNGCYLGVVGAKLRVRPVMTRPDSVEGLL
jgi:hypothetical protein